MSSSQIFEGTSASQGFRVVNMKKCKKTTKLIVDDAAFLIFCAATIEVNDLRADTNLYGTSTAPGFQEVRASPYKDPLPSVNADSDCNKGSIMYGGMKYLKWELVSDGNEVTEKIFHTGSSTLGLGSESAEDQVHPKDLHSWSQRHEHTKTPAPEIRETAGG
jgi:hypothetical protein